MSEVGETDAPTEETEALPELVERLCPGRPITAREAGPITAGSRSRLIVLAGTPLSGKTTLIASLFHCFQRGTFAEYLFAGSWTLLGFDERCHDARIRSLRPKPTTERTKTGTIESLLHLQVMHVERLQIRDLLFVDISGEHFDAIRDSVNECRNVPFLRRADHFVLLIDGERLADVSQRQTAKANARLILRSCFDSGELKPSALVDVLISKWDEAQLASDADAFTTALESEFQEQFESRCRRLRVVRVAARPASTALPLGWNMEDVFRGWVEDLPESYFEAPELRVSTTYSEFDRFGVYYG